MCSCSRMPFHIRHGGWLGGVELGMPASSVEPAANAHICTLVSYPAKALSRVSSLCFALQFSKFSYRFKRLLRIRQASGPGISAALYSDARQGLFPAKAQQSLNCSYSFVYCAFHRPLF